MRSLIVVSILVAALLSGCIASDPVSDVSDEPVSDAPSVQDRLSAQAAALGCEPAWTKGETSPMFEPINDFVNDEVTFGEADAIDGTDLVVVSHYGGGGFDVLNVSDPYDIEHVVGFPIEESYSLDIKVSPDGKTLYSGGFGEITIVDINNITAPVIQTTVPYPQEASSTSAQAHMLHSALINDEEYLFAASQWGHGVLIFHVAGDPGAKELHFLTYFAPAVGGPIAAHDMTVMHDPVEDKPILWVANGFGGFIAADVSDPAVPVPLSYTPEADPYQGYTHTISVTFYDGKRYAVTMAELGAMALKIYDVTVLGAPILLGTWTIDTIPLSTQHNTQILGDYMWLGHYGQGVLFFDLNSTVHDIGLLPAYNIGPLASITPVGQFRPEGTTWESIVIDGVHYTTTGSTLHVTLNGCLDAGAEDADAYV